MMASMIVDRKITHTHTHTRARARERERERERKREREKNMSAIGIEHTTFYLQNGRAHRMLVSAVA